MPPIRKSPKNKQKKQEPYSKKKNIVHYLNDPKVSASQRDKIYSKNEDIINEVLDFIRKPSTLNSLITNMFLTSPINSMLEHFNFNIKKDINLADETYTFDYMFKELSNKIDSVFNLPSTPLGIKKILYGRIKNYNYEPNMDNNETHFQTFAIFIYNDNKIEYYSFDPASGCLPCMGGHKQSIYYKQATYELVSRLTPHYGLLFIHIENSQKIKCQYGISMAFAGKDIPKKKSGLYMSIKDELAEDNDTSLSYAFQDVNCQTWCLFLLCTFLRSKVMNDPSLFENAVPNNTTIRYKLFYNFIHTDILSYNPKLQKQFANLSWEDLLVHIDPVSQTAIIHDQQDAEAADFQEKKIGEENKKLRMISKLK